MHSKRSLEGYLLIENRHAPAVSEDVARASGKNPIGAGVNGVFEASILTCSHCHAQMIVNPMRTRERPFCRKCDHYLCDGCAAVANLTGECTPLKKSLDLAQERAITKGTAHGPLVL